MTGYRNPAAYSNPNIYRRGFRPALTYRNGLPYRNQMSYGASESTPSVMARFGLGGVMSWGQATPGHAIASARFGRMHAIAAFAQAPWGTYGSAYLHTAVPVHSLARHDPLWAFPFGDVATHEAASWALAFADAQSHDESTALRWADIETHSADTTSAPFSRMAALGVNMSAPWGALAAHVLDNSLLWRRLVERGAYVALPWGPIAAREAGTVITWPPTPPDPGDEPITIPFLPVYVMLPTMSAVRLPDRAPIPLLGISLQADLDSWAWSFTAPMARKGVALLNAPDGELTEIEVAINGFIWTFAVEAFDDNRRFGSHTVSLRGKSRSATLGEPYAPKRTFTQDTAKDASQLAGDELVDTGWTLIWDAVDWLVPGGTFGYQDLAPIDAIAQVANAIGATVLSNPETKELTVQARYPDSPWVWDAATPYAIIPSTILTEGDSSWVGGINADGVYVFAETVASGAFVIITGSAGAKQLQPIVDRLVTHADAQRERGRDEIAGAGIKRRVNRTVPLFPRPAPTGQPDLGVVPLGSLVEIQDLEETWRGQVMGVRIDAQRSGSAMSVRQHLTIERQYR